MTYTLNELLRKSPLREQVLQGPFCLEDGNDVFNSLDFIQMDMAQNRKRVFEIIAQTGGQTVLEKMRKKGNGCLSKTDGEPLDADGEFYLKPLDTVEEQFVSILNGIIDFGLTLRTFELYLVTIVEAEPAVEEAPVPQSYVTTPVVPPVVPQPPVTPPVASQSPVAPSVMPPAAGLSEGQMAEILAAIQSLQVAKNVTEPVDDQAIPCPNHVFFKQRGRKWAIYIGDVQIEPYVFDYVSMPTSDGYSIVVREGAVGLYALSSQIYALPCLYNEIRPLGTAGWLVNQSGCWGVFDGQAFLIPCVFHQIQWDGAGYFDVKKLHFLGQIDQYGNWLTPLHRED